MAAAISAPHSAARAAHGPRSVPQTQTAASTSATKGSSLANTVVNWISSGHSASSQAVTSATRAPKWRSAIARASATMATPRPTLKTATAP